MTRNFVASALVLVAAASTLAQTGTPKLVVSHDNWDIGQIWESEPTQLIVTLKNEGDAKLVITEARTTCGCTLAQPDKKELAPGEATTMTVRFDPHGKQGDVTSKVIITSNDPARPEVNIPIKVHVKRAVKREPLGGLVIRTLDTKPGSSAVLKLDNQLAEPMKLELTRNTISEVDIEIKEVTPGVSYEVIGKTNKEMKPGIIRGDLSFKSGLSREGTFSIPVRVQILSKIEAVPAAIYMRPQDTRSADRTVTLQYYGADGVNAFKVTDAKSSHPSVTVTLEPTKAAAPWLLNMKPPVSATVDAKVKVPPPSELPPGGVKIEFTTTDPDMPKIDVLVTADKAAFEERMYGRYSSGGGK